MALFMSKLVCMTLLVTAAARCDDEAEAQPPEAQPPEAAMTAAGHTSLVDN